MSLQRRLDRIILDLGDILDECRYDDEEEGIQKALDVLRETSIRSDLFE